MRKFAFCVLVAVLFAGCGQKPAEKKESLMPSSSRSSSAGVVEGQANRMLEDGKEALNKGNVADAVLNFNEAIKANPHDSQGYLLLGQTYLRLKEYDQAVGVFETELRMDPSNGEVAYLLAIAYGMKGDRDAALESAQRSVEIFQDQQDKDNFMKALALLQGLANK